MDILLDEYIDLSKAETTLLDPEKRVKWDCNISEARVMPGLNNVEIAYTVANFPWPFDKREFIEQRVRCSEPGQIKIIFHGIEDHEDFPLEPKHVRAVNHFGYNSFRTILGKTEITLVSQSDTKLNFKSPLSATTLVLK
jgi:hypothetical protein